VPAAVHEVEEWKHAYRVLDMPFSASPAAIKQNYRKLIKRWHPDLFASGSVEQAEASDMTRLINEAYASIARAPRGITPNRSRRICNRAKRIPALPVGGPHDHQTGVADLFERARLEPLRAVARILIPMPTGLNFGSGYSWDWLSAGSLVWSYFLNCM
jgi:hypothetical protein